MPNKVVYREIEEMTGITLEEYLVAVQQINASEKGSTDDLKVEAGTGLVN